MGVLSSISWPLGRLKGGENHGGGTVFVGLFDSRVWIVTLTDSFTCHINAPAQSDTADAYQSSRH